MSERPEQHRANQLAAKVRKTKVSHSPAVNVSKNSHVLPAGNENDFGEDHSAYKDSNSNKCELQFRRQPRFGMTRPNVKHRQLGSARAAFEQAL